MFLAALGVEPGLRAVRSSHAARAPDRPVKLRIREIPAGGRVGRGERRQAPPRPLSLAHAVGPTAPPQITGSPGPWPGAFVWGRKRPAGSGLLVLARLRVLEHVEVVVPDHDPHVLAFLTVRDRDLELDGAGLQG